LALNMFDKKHLVVLYLDISQEDSVWRNEHRRICELLRHTILCIPETERLTICPIDGSKLVKRELDDPQVIKTRLEEFKKQTLPLLSYFQENGITILKVSGEGTVSEVFSRISEQLARAIKQ